MCIYVSCKLLQRFLDPLSHHQALLPRHCISGSGMNIAACFMDFVASEIEQFTLLESNVAIGNPLEMGVSIGTPSNCFSVIILHCHV